MQVVHRRRLGVRRLQIPVHAFPAEMAAPAVAVAKFLDADSDFGRRNDVPSSVVLVQRVHLAMSNSAFPTEPRETRVCWLPALDTTTHSRDLRPFDLPAILTTEARL